MNEIIFVFCDDWQAIYVNGELKSYLFSSNFNNNFERFSTVKGDIGIVKTFYKKVTNIFEKGC